MPSIPSIPSLASMSMTTFTSPMAIVATVAMVLLVLEANYLLRMSLRRRKQRKLKLGIASIKTSRLSSVQKETDIETPTTSKMPPLPRAPSTTGQKTATKEKVAMERCSKVKLLPLPEYNKSNISPKLRAVPIERECSVEQRLGAAILNVIKSQEEQPVLEPIEIINKLRGKTKEIDAQYGCAVFNGSKVTFVEDLDDALKIAHNNPEGTSTRAVLMPSSTEDEQTKSLIGKARKVARRCAECTRPLISEDATTFVCSSCSTHKDTAAATANQDDTDNEWQSVKPRRRRKSEKRTNNKQKKGRNNRKLSPRGKTSSHSSSHTIKTTGRAVTRGQKI
mmetsp:Transcript_15179/g.18226  ORF Transcript_15179/g.18226 Transcript_15179/m.18226 type:complete len:336 (-) Transcript_15179:95-1102(-)|eukprot:jgi/Bigna1/89837/estExt_fgenesh1_pg.C_560091